MTAYYNSNFETNPGQRYWTEPAITAALARRLPTGIKKIYEPSAGRGDMAESLGDFGFHVVASDIDLSEFDPGICTAFELDFLKDQPPPNVLRNLDAIITNPPFGKEAELFARKALSYQDVRYVALLLRTVWKSASGRTDLFTDPQYHFAHEIALTWRPRWDWWFRDKAEKSPIHNYSWYVWDREWTGPNTTYWATRTH